MVDHVYVGGGAGFALKGIEGGGKPFPRQGAWGLHKGKVGIVAMMHVTGPTCEFHVTDEHGKTVLVLPCVETAEVIQARHDHIPEKRRPDLKTALRLGYAGPPSPRANPIMRLVHRIFKG